MDLYRFGPTSPVAQVEFTQDAKKVWLARIFAQPGTPPDELSDLTTLLNQRQDGIIAVPESAKGVHTLFASGFTSPEALLSQLISTGHTKDLPQREKLTQEAENYTAKMRDGSLKLAGIFYLMSDAALATSGILSGRYKETVAGALYSSGGVMLARYGHKDAHTHLKDLSLQLGDFFTREGIALPENGPIMGANKERGNTIVESLERFAYTYPSQIFNAVVATCGIQLLQSGIAHKKQWDTTSGALALSGALAGLLIPEKSKFPRLAKPEAKPPSTGPLARAYDWVQEKPLRVPGILWFGNNIALTISALGERKADPTQSSYKFKLAYAAAAIIGNGLMTISSKQSAERYAIDSESMQALLSVAASVVIQQPPQMQEQIIQNVAGFMSSQPHMQCTAAQMADAIRTQVAELAANPFMPQNSSLRQEHFPIKATKDWRNSLKKHENLSLSH